MKSLGSYTGAILKLVRESLSGLSIPSPAASSGSAPTPLFNPIPPPYVTVGDKSELVFMYGVSEYGGDDIVYGEIPPRIPKRYFLSLSGE